MTATCSAKFAVCLNAVPMGDVFVMEVATVTERVYNGATRAIDFEVCGGEYSTVWYTHRVSGEYFETRRTIARRSAI